MDWSNQAQTLRVEWDGPTSRYFWSGSLSSRVYYKGAVLLDVSLIEGGLVGRTGGQVCGACITRDADGHLLIVAIRYGSEQGTGTSRRDVFLAVPLAVDAVHFVPGAKFEQQPKLQAVTAEAILLLDQERGANVDDYRHPWMFSDDGRQARCVRPKFTTELHELVFTVSNPRNPASASLQSVVKPWPMATTSVERISTYQTLHIEAIADFASSGANPPGTPPITALFHAVPWRNSAFATPGCEFDELVEEKVTTIYGMTAALLCAVDFDGNVPVYAHRIPAVKTRVVHNTSNHTWAFSATISNLNHGRYPQDPAQSIIDNNALYGYDAAGTVSETAQRRWTTTDTGHDGGYAFPWGRSSHSQRLRAITRKLQTFLVHGNGLSHTIQTLLSAPLAGVVYIPVGRCVSVWRGAHSEQLDRRARRRWFLRRGARRVVPGPAPRLAGLPGG